MVLSLESLPVESLLTVRLWQQSQDDLRYDISPHMGYCIPDECKGELPSLLKELMSGSGSDGGGGGERVVCLKKASPVRVSLVEAMDEAGLLRTIGAGTQLTHSGLRAMRICTVFGQA